MATSPTRNEKCVGCAEAGAVAASDAVLKAAAASKIFTEVLISILLIG
jgi:hypothetical protein